MNSQSKLIDGVRIPYIAPSQKGRELILWWDKNIAENRHEQIPARYFFPKSRSAEENSFDALCLFRHFAEDVLAVNPFEFSNLLSAELIKDFCLDKAYLVVFYPKELKGRPNNYWYVACACYPEFLPIKKQLITLSDYISALASSDKRSCARLFSDQDFLDRRHSACICLSQWMRSHPEPEWTDLEAAYLFFADKKKSTKYLKDARLLSLADRLFPSHLYFFHETLPEKKRDAFYLDYADFMARSGLLDETSDIRKRFPFLKEEMQSSVEAADEDEVHA